MLKKIALYHVEVDTANENMSCELLTPPTIETLREIADDNWLGNAPSDLITVLGCTEEVVLPETTEDEDFAETTIMVAGSEVGRITVTIGYIYAEGKSAKKRGRPAKKAKRGRPAKAKRGRPAKKAKRGRPAKKAKRGRPAKK